MAQTVHLKLTIDGSDIIGESTIESLDRADTIQCFHWEYEVITPHQSASGRATGHRQHQPIKFTKRIDRSTPLLFKALCMHERVDEAEFRFYRPDVSGQEVHFYTVKVSKGFVASIYQVSEDASMGDDAAPVAMEEISLVYRDIEITETATGAAHADSLRGKKAGRRKRS